MNSPRFSNAGVGVLVFAEQLDSQVAYVTEAHTLHPISSSPLPSPCSDPQSEAGNASGMVHLGLCYAAGTGVAKDESETVKWFRLAAEGGDSDGMFHLGSCYKEGRGVAKDEREAVKWYRMAADTGDEKAAQLFRENLRKLGW